MAFFYAVKAILILYILPYGSATRFLPMVVWDNLNPQLHCQCNWLTIPHTDLYDRLDLVCPTLKIAVKQLDGYSRPEEEMNENIFRRKWHGTEDDLRNRIRNGSMDSFCDPSNSDTTKIHTCKNGQYSSKAVTFIKNKDQSKDYKVGQIYIFFNNGNDGKESALQSKTAKCTMMFAVYVSEMENVEYDITYGKTALSNQCNCTDVKSGCKSSATKPDTSAQPTSKSLGDTTTVEALERRSSRGTKDLSTTSSSGTPSSIYPTSTTENASTNCKDKGTQDSIIKCEHGWLTMALFIVSIVATCLISSICTLLCITIRKKVKKKNGFSNAIYYAKQSENGLPENTTIDGHKDSDNIVNGPMYSLVNNNHKEQCA